MDGERAVMSRTPVADWRADEQQRQQAGGGGDDRVDRCLHRVEHCGLLQQIADRVAGQAKFGEYREGDALGMGTTVPYPGS